MFSDKGVVLVPGQVEQWERTVRKSMPEYSFGNDGCWINKHGVLTYVPENEFTKDILDVMERQAKQAGMPMESHFEQEGYVNGHSNSEAEDLSQQITR